MKKRLQVPFIAELDRLPLEDVSALLTQRSYMHSMTYVNWETQYPYKPLTSFSVARGTHDLFVRFYVHGNCLRAVNEQDQSPVYEDSCVGFAIHNPHTDQVFDFAFNCIGTCQAIERRNQETILLEDHLVHQIRRCADLSRRPFCEMEGMFSWQLVAAIPFSLVGLEPSQIPAILSGNFYKRADATSLPHYISWQPVMNQEKDFSMVESFGQIEFND